jgi:hypothetical protein
MGMASPMLWRNRSKQQNPVRLHQGAPASPRRHASFALAPPLGAAVELSHPLPPGVVISGRSRSPRPSLRALRDGWVVGKSG